MNRVVRIGCLCLIAAAFITVVYRRGVVPGQSRDNRIDGVGNSQPLAGQTFHHNIEPAKNQQTTRELVEKHLPNYKSDFGSSNDYWRFAHNTLPAAASGNKDAQFYLSKAIEYCSEHNDLYFTRNGRPLGIDEGLQYAAQRKLPIDLAQSVYDRCHEFMDHDNSDLGKAIDWLARAAAAGQPMAQAVTASKLLMQAFGQNLATAAGVPNPSKEGIATSSEEDPRELLRAAVQSRDPEVLFDIGESQSLLNPTNVVDIDVIRFAWWLVACQRGFDCSGTAEWVKNSCGGDPACVSANSPSDLVMVLAGDKWPQVQVRARDLSISLDQGQWNALGLGT